jgi:hypothetical protein
MNKKWLDAWIAKDKLDFAREWKRKVLDLRARIDELTARIDNKDVSAVAEFRELLHGRSSLEVEVALTFNLRGQCLLETITDHACRDDTSIMDAAREKFRVSSQQLQQELETVCNQTDADGISVVKALVLIPSARRKLLYALAQQLRDSEPKKWNLVVEAIGESIRREQQIRQQALTPEQRKAQVDENRAALKRMNKSKTVGATTVQTYKSQGNKTIYGTPHKRRK